MNSRRTKIVCTLGPASRDTGTIERMLEAGMDVVRINMSHGTHDEHTDTIMRVRETAKRKDRHVPIMMDLTGPKIRIGAFGAGAATLIAGAQFTLTTRPVSGDASGVSINYPPLVADVGVGDRVLMGDGEIELRVKSKTNSDLVCDVVAGGELKSNKGVSTPGAKLREEVPTAKDLDDVRFGLAQGIDYFALSFVRFPREVQRLRECLRKNGADTPVVVKLEKKEAIENLDEILKASDAVMVARGDLGLDIPLEEVPLVQKDCIQRAVAAGRPVITATQMLESMIEHPRPTRAEAADVANAVFDGTDAVMLSGETAVGKFPVEAIGVMARIATASEARIDYAARLGQCETPRHRPVAEAIAHAACHTAIGLDASVIICCTRSGQTARLVSRYRPPVPIAAVSPSEETLRRSTLFWGTIPVAAFFENNVDRMVAHAKAAVRKAGLGREGDRVVVVAGVPIDEPGTTNVVKAEIL